MHVWGGRAWTRLVDAALTEMGNLDGKSVLELGFHDGAMAREFARRGALVTALEVSRKSFDGVERTPGIAYRLYDGNLDEIAGTYDFVFTKSVLVLTELEAVMPAICRKLRPGGCAVFIENGAGLPVVSWLRYALKPRSVWGNVRYLDGRSVRLIGEHFTGFEVRQSYFPPVYLMVGHNSE